MRLEDMRVAVSPRRSWEAMDLGLAGLGRWRAQVYLPWLATMLPLSALTCLALGNHPGWIPLVLWFAKPLLGRVPLHVLGTAVFGPAPRPAETLARLPQLLLRRPFLSLLHQRFSSRRGLVQPVDLLEQPKGPARKARLRVLTHGSHGGSATTAVILFALFETGLSLSIAALLIFFGPAEWQQSSAEFFEYSVLDTTLDWILAASYIAAISILEPAFVASGFGLYLCRRADLEGWDIELGFRMLARRLREAAGSVSAAGGAALLFALAALAPPAQAAQDGTPAQRPDPAAVAHEVLSSSDFDTTITSQEWVPPNPDFGPLDGVMSVLAPLLVAVAWIVGAALLVSLIAHLVSKRTRRSPAAKGSGPQKRPEKAFGLDLRQDSLPGDPAGEALALWNRGQLREALSLLYRGALVHLVDAEQLDIRASDTEQDCVRRVHGLDAAPKAQYFERLTTAWLYSAWGARPPAHGTGQSWCEAWTQHFGGAR